MAEPVTTPTPPAPSAPAAPSAPSSAPPATPPSQPAAPSSTPAPASPPTEPAAASTPSAPSWLSAFKERGIAFDDEKKAIEALAQAHRDAETLRPLSPYVSAYQQHQADFHKWLQEREAPPAPKQEDWTAELGWKPPEWNPAWQTMIRDDGNGNIVPAPGAPPDVVAKYNAYRAFRAEQADRLLQNPYEYMQPAIKHWAEKIAQDIVQRELSQYRNQQDADRFVAEASPWLYVNENGQPKVEKVFNPQTGRYEARKVLSPWGELFGDKVAQRQRWYQEKGIPIDQEEMKQWAMTQVQIAYLMSQAQQPSAPAAPAEPPKTPREQANDDFLQRNNPAARKPGSNSVPAKQKVTESNLEEQLATALKASGGAI